MKICEELTLLIHQTLCKEILRIEQLQRSGCIQVETEEPKEQVYLKLWEPENYKIQVMDFE